MTKWPRFYTFRLRLYMMLMLFMRRPPYTFAVGIFFFFFLRRTFTVGVNQTTTFMPYNVNRTNISIFFSFFFVERALFWQRQVKSSWDEANRAKWFKKCTICGSAVNFKRKVNSEYFNIVSSHDRTYGKCYSYHTSQNVYNWLRSWTPMSICIAALQCVMSSKLFVRILWIDYCLLRLDWMNGCEIRAKVHLLDLHFFSFISVLLA